MWNNPRTLLEITGHVTWNNGVDGQVWSKPCPSGYDAFACPPSVILKDALEGHELAMKLYDELRAKAVGLPNAAPTREFQSLFASTVTNLAKRIERNQEWSLIPALYWVVNNWHYAGFTAQSRFLEGIVRTLHLLVGDERRCLVGTKNNAPAWKMLERPATPADYSKLMYLDFPIEYVTQADVDIVPSPVMCLGGRVFDKEWPKDFTWRMIRKLVEDAYYNQRFLVHPKGASVRINGYPGVISMTLKAKRSIWDENAYDLLANIELEEGSYFCVLDGLMATNPHGHRDEDWEETPNNPRNFFYFLVAQVYHDLVTSREIKVERSRKRSKDKGERGGTAVASPTTETSEWVYLPRLVRGETYEPRVETASPRIASPHHVTGHLRRANMSEEHRLALVRFEEETGLQVLRFVPEGYTFVRPHVSPKADPSELDKLPKFIKARIQDDIKRMMSGNN